MIGIIDYGLGNIKAFLNVYERLGIEAKVINKPDEFEGINKIILPGVGAFDHAMTQLNESGLRFDLEKCVLDLKIPVLGICVGMQMLANSSEEGKLPGLGWIDGVVKKFDYESIPYKTRLPHMGWNSIHSFTSNSILYGIDPESRFYFLHSFYFECNKIQDVLTTTNYGIEFNSAVNNKHIYGVQFHPEKSHQNGINLLKNFSLL
jgi:glutamine amidotransferase